MDVASSVVAFVGIAGQLLQGISFIHDFLSDIHDAPEDVEQLRIRLGLLGGILRNMVDHSQAVCAMSNLAGIIKEAMELVDSQIAKLAKLVRECSPRSSGRKALIWSNLGFAFRKSKFAKYIANLDHAQDLLEIAQRSVNSDILSQHTETLHDVQQTLVTIQDSNLAVLAAVKHSSRYMNQSSNNLEESDPSIITAASKLHETSAGFDNATSFTRADGGFDPAVYHNQWIGTVKVTRKMTTTKAWSASEQAYEIENRTQRIHIQVRPVPWLLRMGAGISFGVVRAVYGSSRVYNSIEPLRYTIIPRAARDAIDCGNLSSLKRLLRDGEISVYDRCNSTGASLLELCFQRLLPNLMLDDSPEDYIHDPDVIRTSLWLVSQGLTAEFDGTSLFNKNNRRDEWFFATHLASQHNMSDLAAVVNDRERFSISITEEMPPILRAQKLLLFAILNTDHSLHLESIIWDLIQDIPEEDMVIDKHAKREYWAKGDLISFGIETELVHSLFKIRKASRVLEPALKFSMEEDARIGPRRLLSHFLAAKLRDDVDTDIKEITDFAANYLRLSKGTLILENGFGNHLSTTACRMNRLDMWHNILKMANHPVVDFMSRHFEADQRLQKPLQVTLSKGTVSLIARDPHYNLNAEQEHLWQSIKSYQEPVYDSLSHVEHNSLDVEVCSDICFTRQEGTELFFDCGVTDPDFDRQGHWDNEVDFWQKFDSDHHRYTHIELEEAEEKIVEVDVGGKTVEEVVDITGAASRGFLAQIVSGGVSVIRGIV